MIVVDHAPWPTEGNRGQRRAYGSVFKAAAIRWGIYLVVEAKTLYAEARGNNLTGLARTPVTFDADRLELRLLEAPSQEVDLDARIADYLRRNAGASTTAIAAGVEGKATAIRRRLADSDRFVNVPPILFGKPRNAKCWARAEDVQNLLNATPSENRDGVGTGLRGGTNDNPVPPADTYEVGGGRDGVRSSPRPDAETGLDDDAVEEAER